MSFEIKAIVFDYGNVLCRPQAEEDVAAMAAALSMPVEEFVSVYWPDRIAYDSAAMGPSAYWTKVARRELDSSAVDKLVALDNKSWTNPSMKMIDYAVAVRQNGLKTALLSNLPSPLRDALETDCPWLPEFDVKTYSCEIGTTKPDQKIYEACVKALGVKPVEAVFLDDRAENVKGAMAFGMHALLFDSPEKAILDLATEYGVRLPQSGLPDGPSRGEGLPART